MAASPESMTSEVSTTKQDDFCTMEDDTGREISLNMTKDEIEATLGEKGTLDSTAIVPPDNQKYDYSTNHMEIIYQEDTIETANSIFVENAGNGSKWLLKPNIGFDTSLDDIRKAYLNKPEYIVDDPGNIYIKVSKYIEGCQYNRNIYYNENANNALLWFSVNKKS